MNNTKLAKLADLTCCMEIDKSVHLDNTPVNTDVGDKHDGQKFMKLSEYMNKVCTETYMFHGSI